MSNPLKRACEFFGGQAQLAEELGISKQMVHKWLKGNSVITPIRAMEIEDLTGGAVTAEELRPDLLWPKSKVVHGSS